MDSAMANIVNAMPLGKSVSTGTMVLQSYHATSGFHYQIGIREMSGLYIMEGFYAFYAERSRRTSGGYT